MTMAAGTSQIQPHRNKTSRSGGGGSGGVSESSRMMAVNRSSHRNEIVHPESESDTSVSPTNEFSNTPTYRIPAKPSRGNFSLNTSI